MNSFKPYLIVGTAVVILGALWCTDILAQRGRGGGGGGRSAAFRIAWSGQWSGYVSAATQAWWGC